MNRFQQNQQAQNTLGAYLSAIIAREWQEAANHTQITWKSETDKLEQNATQWLEHRYDGLGMIGFDFSRIEMKTVGPAMIDFRFMITFQIGEFPIDRSVTIRVIRETAPFKPNCDEGTWGVNPISLHSVDN